MTEATPDTERDRKIVKLRCAREEVARVGSLRNRLEFYVWLQEPSSGVRPAGAGALHLVLELVSRHAVKRLPVALFMDSLAPAAGYLQDLNH
jgi:hypothetical protein